MSVTWITTIALAGLVITTGSSATAAPKVDATFRAELEQVARQRIFFAHQSVGGNLIEGIKQLSAMAGVPIRILETPTATTVPSATFGHTQVAKNGEPLLKLQGFEQALGNHPSGIDIALVKFCYVDFNSDTDPEALFRHYRATIDSLRAKNPATTFVHVTAPLTSKSSGPKEFLKRLLGRGGAAQNMRREEYNSLLRKAYQGREPIFDLAHVESVAPDGTIATEQWKNRIVPVMASVYTDDGGHLNEAGRLRAAREFVAILAAIHSRTASHNLAH
jgi:hypothetical protein